MEFLEKSKSKKIIGSLLSHFGCEASSAKEFMKPGCGFTLWYPQNPGEKFIDQLYKNVFVFKIENNVNGSGKEIFKSLAEFFADKPEKLHIFGVFHNTKPGVVEINHSEITGLLSDCLFEAYIFPWPNYKDCFVVYTHDGCLIFASNNNYAENFKSNNLNSLHPYPCQFMTPSKKPKGKKVVIVKDSLKKGIPAEELRKVLSKWQSKLFMDDWKIDLIIADFQRDDGFRQSGKPVANLKKKTGTIYLTCNPFRDEEYVLLHELLHILFWDFDSYADSLILKKYHKDSSEYGWYLEKLENLVEKTTWALLGRKEYNRSKNE